MPAGINLLPFSATRRAVTKEKHEVASAPGNVAFNGNDVPRPDVQQPPYSMNNAGLIQADGGPRLAAVPYEVFHAKKLRDPFVLLPVEEAPKSFRGSFDPEPQESRPACEQHFPQTTPHTKKVSSTNASPFGAAQNGIGKDNIRQRSSGDEENIGIKASDENAASENAKDESNVSIAKESDGNNDPKEESVAEGVPTAADIEDIVNGIDVDAKPAKVGHDDKIKETPEKLTPEAIQRQLHAVGKAAFGMVSNEKFQPHDVEEAIAKQPMKIRLDNFRNDMGHNIMHHVIIEARPSFLEMIFCFGYWNELASQPVAEDKGSQFARMLPKQVAEKLLPKAKGPQVLEEFEYFDALANGMTSLNKACLLGNIEDVKLLIKKTAESEESLDAKDSSGFNCFAYAAASGSVPIMELLLEHGINPMMLNDRNETILHLAAKRGNSKAVSFILNRCMIRPEILDKQRQRAIDHVASNGDIATMKAFQEGGVHPDDKCVPLAAKNQRKDMVQYLLEDCNLDVNGRDENGRTAFLNACLRGNTELVKFLLAKGANILEKDKHQRNCFHLAADNNSEDTLIFLAERALELNFLNKLMNAKDKFSGREIVLLVRGRDRGRPAWHFVEVKRSLIHQFRVQLSRGSIDVKEFGRILFSGFGRSPDSSVREQVEDVFKDRLEGADEDPDMTPLHLAAFKDHSVIIEKLLLAGAEPNLVDTFGQSPLHLVAMKGNVDCAKLLEAKGAQLDIKDRDGRTAADVARDNEHTDLENYLRGKQYYPSTKRVRETLLGKLQSEFSEEKLEELRQNGADVRRHIVAILRDMAIDINEALLDLGSGPIMEETTTR